MSSSQTCVRSIGNPYVSHISKATLLSMSFFPCFLASAAAPLNRLIPLSSVLLKLTSSSLHHSRSACLTLPNRRAAHIHEAFYMPARQAACFYSCLKSFICWRIHIAQGVGHAVGCEPSSPAKARVFFCPSYDYKDVALFVQQT